MEWCGEIYREMNVEDFIRRGMSVVLVVMFLLSMIIGGDSVTEEKEVTVIRGDDAGTLSSGVGLFPEVFGLAGESVDLTVRDGRRLVPALSADKSGTGIVPVADGAEISDTALSDAGMMEVPVAEMTVAEGMESDIPPLTFPGEESAKADVPEMDTPSPDTPAADIPKMDAPAADIPAADVPVPDLPGSGDVLTDEPGADIPAPALPGTGDEVAETPAEDVPEDSGSSGEISDGATEDPAESPTDGFIIDESGMIRGISDVTLAVSDLCLNLPAGCTGIARGAFAGVAEEIVEVHIPSGITCIEEGAFLGLSQVCKFEVEAGNSMYYTENGVLFSEGGSCILAFPAGRTGIYSVPSGVTRFAADAFAGSMLSKIDTRACTLEDAGNLPESISIL